jgi:hypothetical protein
MRGESGGSGLNAGMHVRIHVEVHASGRRVGGAGSPRYTPGRGVGKRGALPSIEAWGKRDVVGRGGLLRSRESSACLFRDAAVPQQNAFRRWRTPRKRL